MAEDFGSNDVGEPVQSCGSDAAPKYWIEIEMMDQNGDPVSFAEYCVTTPSGDSVKGYLDDKGWARLEGLAEAGDCEVGFPKFDKNSWDYSKSLPPKQSDDGSDGTSSQDGLSN
jgi:hypothetical protein